MNHRQSDVNNFLKDRISPYPAYKDSGIEWLGRIPVHWEVAATKRLCHIINGGTPKSSEPRYWYGEVTWITPEDLGNLDKRNILSSKRKITSDGQQNSSATIIPAGSLVLSTRAPIGHIGIAGVNLCTNQGCRGLVMRHECSEVYHYFQFSAYRTALEELGQGSTFSELSTDSLGSFRIGLPPLPEQRAIAAFLDRETARIDALVAKRERLIELLQEKRAALISDAVTKGLPADAAAQAGLDPNVPTRDSGVEWLGEIPAHWEVMRLKHLATVNDEALPETTDPGMEIAYVDIGNVDSIQGITDAEVMLFEDAPSRARRVVRQGDVIVSTVRTYLRAIAQIETTDANLIVSTGFAVIRPRQMDYGYVAYVATAPYFVGSVVAHSVGVSYPAINASELACLDVVFPPIDEQCAIAAFLDFETAKIHALVGKVCEAIDRLKELSMALISAAVTGKIDVRNEFADSLSRPADGSQGAPKPSE